MLVLTRKAGESINIGDDIVIRIMDVKGRSVRVGIEAPKNMAIHREEVYSRIQEENRLATSWKSVDMESLKKIMGDMGGDKR